MEARVAQPRWVAGVGPVGAGGEEVEEEPGYVGDVVAAGPFVADFESVGREGLVVPAPHEGSGVVAPADGGVGEGVRAEDLQALDALFAETAVIEASGGAGEAGIGEEGLQRGLLGNAVGEFAGKVAEVDLNPRFVGGGPYVNGSFAADLF